MAKRSDAAAAVVAAAEAANTSPANRPRPHEPHQAEFDQARRVQALTLRLAGLSYEAIAERMEISLEGARGIIQRTLSRAEQAGVEEMRALENHRLDRAQAAIWSDVLAGDIKAINAFLRISAQRAKINGLEAPTKIDLSLSIKQEMEEALNGLEELILKEGVYVSGDSERSAG